MRYRFVFTDWFNHNLKTLHKHNPNLRADLEVFLETFEAEAHPIIPGTGGARKARMKSKGKGKRGGYQVIYYKEDLSADEKIRVQKLVQAIKDEQSEEGDL